MTSYTNGFAPSTPAQLAQQVWQVPPTAENTPSVSGGVLPGPVPVAPAPAPVPGYAPPQPPSPIVYGQPPVQQYGQQPAAPPVQPTPAPKQNTGRAEIDRLVSAGRISMSDAAMFRNDQELIDALYEVATAERVPEKPQTQEPPAPAQPSGPAGLSGEELSRTLMALQQGGAIEFQNGQYTSKHPEFAPIAERANQERLRQEMSLRELSDPKAWLKKHSADLLKEATTPLEQKIALLEKQLRDSSPKPHEAWIAKYDGHLRVRDQAGNPVMGTDGTPQLTPAGLVYHRTYEKALQSGMTDEKTIHEIAASAAENVMQFSAPQQAPQPKPPQTYAQASAAYQPQYNPGFNLPGTALSRQQAPQPVIPVNNRGGVDFRGIADGILNGSIPRQ